VSLGVKPPTAAGQLSARTRQVTFRRRLERLASTMSATAPSLALPRRFAAVLIAALLGLTLALNPMSAAKAHAAVPANVALAALRIAATQRGVLYRYGGESHWTGFDCSGLTQWSYARAGRYIPRVAQQQYDATIHIPASARRQGDLVFFHTGNSVYHVGIFAGGWYMIDAPHTGARVRMEMIWPGALFGRVR
jgi:cell wall-associated NlpC family hydrolase